MPKLTSTQRARAAHADPTAPASAPPAPEHSDPPASAQAGRSAARVPVGQRSTSSLLGLERRGRRTGCADRPGRAHAAGLWHLRRCPAGGVRLVVHDAVGRLLAEPVGERPGRAAPRLGPRALRRPHRHAVRHGGDGHRPHPVQPAAESHPILRLLRHRRRRRVARRLPDGGHRHGPVVRTQAGHRIGHLPVRLRRRRSQCTRPGVVLHDVRLADDRPGLRRGRLRDPAATVAGVRAHPRCGRSADGRPVARGGRGPRQPAMPRNAPGVTGLLHRGPGGADPGLLDDLPRPFLRTAGGWCRDGPPPVVPGPGSRVLGPQGGPGGERAADGAAGGPVRWRVPGRPLLEAAHRGDRHGRSCRRLAAAGVRACRNG